MAFLDRYGLRGAIDLAGGGLHEAANARLAGGLQDVHGATYVGFDIGVGRGIGKRYSDQRRQMHDVGASRGGRDHEMRIANVAGDDLHGLHDVRGHGIEPAPGVEGIVIDKRSDGRACPDQLLDDVRADEAVAARDENAGVLQIFHVDPNRAIISAFVTGWRYSTTPLRATNRWANGPEIGISEAAVAGRRAGLSRRFPRKPVLAADGALQTSPGCL